VGTDQLHPRLVNHPRLELHEKTDIRSFETRNTVDVILADVSFISLREVLPHLAKLSSSKTDIVVMVKPQFEAVANSVKHKGVIKNDRVRRDILKSFEAWVHEGFIVIDKADSDVLGAKGNRERFYRLRKSVL
jgi:23S rRNA (cytidine1920-2'-O)/16S rRNA (cytidine1409-2'-O)-methyltransferase